MIEFADGEAWVPDSSCRVMATPESFVAYLRVNGICLRTARNEAGIRDLLQ